MFSWFKHMKSKYFDIEDINTWSSEKNKQNFYEWAHL